MYMLRVSVDDVVYLLFCHWLKSEAVMHELFQYYRLHEQVYGSRQLSTGWYASVVHAMKS